VKKETKFYVGVKIVFERHERAVFGCLTEPTHETHGDKFNWVLGPFSTEAGANYMAGAGYNNPSCLTPNDADRFAATGSFAVVLEDEEEQRAA
jgi:hypothetical protein